MNNLKLATDHVKMNQIQKFANVARDIQKKHVLKSQVGSMINNIENAKSP